jgi:hypothetical protein
MDMPVVDATQTNITLDSDTGTFPLGKGIYADFTHDNTYARLLAAHTLRLNSKTDPPV